MRQENSGKRSEEGAGGAKDGLLVEMRKSCLRPSGHALAVVATAAQEAAAVAISATASTAHVDTASATTPIVTATNQQHLQYQQQPEQKMQQQQPHNSKKRIKTQLKKLIGGGGSVRGRLETFSPAPAYQRPSVCVHKQYVPPHKPPADVFLNGSTCE